MWRHLLEDVRAVAEDAPILAGADDPLCGENAQPPVKAAA